MNRAELKTKAKRQMSGRIGMLILIMLIIGIITIAATTFLALIPVVGPLISSLIVGPAFSLSIVKMYLNLTNDEAPEVADAFEGFNDFWSAFKVTFLVGLFTFLWSLLFIIPGIIKSYSYSMSMYILAENKGKPALECIRESQEMTNGYKMDLFVLGLSFLGWILLGCVTLGIAFLWVSPYMYATVANAYVWLKEQAGFNTAQTAEQTF